MDTFPIILLANEPGSYRSLLAAELPFLRPNLRVLEVNPDELDEAVATYRPAVVICSQAPQERVDSRFSTLVLYTEEIDSFIRCGDRTIVNPRLSDILSEIDRSLLAGCPRE